MTFPLTNALPRLPRALLALAAVAVVVLVGCDEKKKVKPAPPPPPPPPPPPAVVSFDSLSQELKVDARISVAPSVSISDEAFARATLKLADAFVRGDADKLKGLTAPRVHAGVATLQVAQEWEPTTKGIEAVRLILIAPPPSNLSSALPEAPPGADIQEAQQFMEIWKNVIAKGRTSGDADAVFSEFEKSLRERAKALKEQGRESEFTQLSQYIIKLMTLQGTKLQNLFHPTSKYAVLMAVQDASGAYLVGWQADGAGENWTFDGAPTLGGVKRRAPDWDGTGTGVFNIAAQAANIANPLSAAPAPTGGTPATPPGSTPPAPAGGNKPAGS
jgi:hypothetical protein